MSRKRKHSRLAKSGPKAGYFRNDTPILTGWRPALREARTDVSAAWRLASARTVDALQNSGWIAGAVTAMTTAIVGDGLQLNARPDVNLFGGNSADRDRWAREAESEFSLFAGNARECDAAGKLTLGQIEAAAVRHWLATGEVLSLMTARLRAGCRYATKVRLLPAWRMPFSSEGQTLIDGVRVDGLGEPVAYRLTELSAYGQTTEKEARARDAAGRPMVIHIFDGDAETVRGISPFAPVLKVVRQYDQLADATLMTTLLQTIFAATIKSPNAPTAAFEALQTEGAATSSPEFNGWMAARQQWYENTRLDLGQHGRIVHLFPTEELNFHAAQHPTETYDAFSSGLLREIAVCIGINYEMLSGDYRNANFSSANVGVAVVWPIALYRRRHIAGSLAGQIYDAWLEEAIASRRLGFPGGIDAFLANRSAAIQARWRGPARPVVDALKVARAQEIQLDRLGATLDSVRSDYGDDWQDDADQRKRESDYYHDLGLPDPHTPSTADRSSADSLIANSD